MKRSSLLSLIFFLAYFFLFSLAGARAVMLSSERIAYVDIEKVFNECESTKQARKKIEKEVEIKRKEIDRLEKEIRDLETSGKKKEIFEPVPTTGLVGEEKVEVSTAPAVPKPVPEEVIEMKKRKLNETVEKIKEELTRLEKDTNYQILGKIYDIVKEIAQAEGYSIVLDKRNILYSEMENDLTDKVIKRLNLGQ